MMRRFHCQRLHQRAQGQALVLVALILTFLMMLVLTCIEIGARYQVCSDKLCLPPRTDKLDVALRIAGRT